MTSKQFFYISVGLSMLIVLSVIILNVFKNEYGIFGDVRNKAIKIYHNERTSKFLMSYNYIPTNFEGIIIGSSVSNNMDTKKIKNYRIYNASISGGNISELKYIAENVIKKGKLKFIVICVYPYLTKDHGKKSAYIDPREYWGSLGSVETLKLYIKKTLITNKYIEDYYNDFGYYNSNIIRKRNDSRRIIREYVAEMKKNDEIVVNEKAYKELEDLIELGRESGIKIFGYFYPYHYDIYMKKEKSYKMYKKKMTGLFDDSDILWDFNTDEYMDFRKDYSNYSDQGHLSYKGADFIMKEIYLKLQKNL